MSDTPSAVLRFRLEADSGYEADGVYACTPDQYRQVIAALEGTLKEMPSLDYTKPMAGIVFVLEDAAMHRNRPDLDDIDALILLRELRQLRAWKEAVIDACVINHLGWDEADPRGTLEELIQWEQTVALDPRVSVQARTLRELAYHQAAEIIHQAAMAAADHNDLRNYELLKALRDAILQLDPEKDRCQRCHGDRGGAFGNENLVDGETLCDACSAEARKENHE